jgi:hypothetical protein
MGRCMKTLTELSGTLVRKAAAAVAEARRSLPRDETPVTPAVVVAPPAPTVAEGAEAAAAPEEGSGASVVPAAAPAVTADPAPKLDPDAENETVKAILDDAVAKATGCTGDRLVMLRDAVKAVGRRAGDVRLVRVFGVEEELRGAHVAGDRQYLIDFLPSNMQQVPDAHRGEKGRGKGRGGGGRGGGGGDRGAKGSTTGGFSMDSLKDDRKGGRGGPGRGPGGPPKK